MSQPGHYNNNMDASGELSTGVPKMPDTYHNPELDPRGHRTVV